MNPVVLIATHNRVEITKRNIESLLRQSVKPHILIVCSDAEELRHYSQYAFTGSTVDAHCFKNNPLGAKWQSGLDRIKDWDSIQTIEKHKSTLIIAGSDDILGDGFIENACRLIEQGNHFIGLRQWWQHKDGIGYQCQYLARNNQPIGGGRVYSWQLLKSMKYRLFEPRANKHLDDLGWNRARTSGLKTLVLEQPEKEGLSIHAVKGDWPMFNKFTIDNKNLKLNKSARSSVVLPSFFRDNVLVGENGNSFSPCVE